MSALELLLLGNLLRRGTRKRRESQPQPLWPDRPHHGGTICHTRNQGTDGTWATTGPSITPILHSPSAAGDSPRCPYCNQPVNRCGCGAY